MSGVLSEWALALMLTVAPPGRSHIRAAVETPEAGRARYAEIATAIADAADGNKRAVALLLAISYHESGGWRRDVDYGIGPLSRGDGGRACTIFQFNFGRGNRCDALLADRVGAAKFALQMARRSFAACRSRPILEQLGAFTAGGCRRGAASSRIRMLTAERFLAWEPARSLPQ